MNMLQKRIADLVLKHDGLNAAAPSDRLLRKLGLRRVVTNGVSDAPRQLRRDDAAGVLVPDEGRMA